MAIFNSYVKLPDGNQVLSIFSAAKDSNMAQFGEYLAAGYMFQLIPIQKSPGINPNVQNRLRPKATAKYILTWKLNSSISPE